MKLTKLAAVIASSSMLMACLDDSSSSSQSAESKLLETNADIAYAIYSDSVITAETLQKALATFKDDPSADNLIAAKKAWLVAREPYGQSEAFRFQDGPIDNETDGPEGDLNAWPLGEALIDYVVINGSDFTGGQMSVEGKAATANDDAIPGNALELGDTNGTVVGNEVTAQNIIASNLTIDATLIEGNSATNADESDVITGYHAIEFLLWGQDLNTSNGSTSGTGTNETDRQTAVKAYNFSHGGQRPLADFVPADVSDVNDKANRRHQYLEVVVTKLVADLKAVQTAWAPNADNYRADFVSSTNEVAKVTKIVEAMGTMAYGELAGERIKVAYSGNSQEDEHSCFSDNTHRDIWLNAEGVSNLYFGDYAGYDSTLNGEDDATTNSVKGYGFDDYLIDKGLTTLNTNITTAINDTKDNYTEVDTLARAGQPFDVLIMDANRDESSAVNKTIEALKTQSNAFIVMVDELGLDSIANSVNTSTEAHD